MKIFAILILMIVCVCALYITFRSEWLLCKRIDLIYEDYNNYLKLKSYEHMLFKRFWVWDFEKLCQE